MGSFKNNPIFANNTNLINFNNKSISFIDCKFLTHFVLGEFMNNKTWTLI